MKKKYVLQAVVMLALLFMALLLPAYAIAQPDSLKNQLDLLSDALEEKRLEFHIPGMAIAVVKDNQIILAKGFGMMDIDQQLPVKKDTLFAIGSTTKAFTATLIAQLVDQGKVQWDDEISQYLPDYQFIVDGNYVPITFRDALSHRTGYTRNDLLWANGKASRDHILKTAIHAEPWDEFRASFHYNNVMYLAAGQAAAAQIDMIWDQWLQTSLLKPLAMNNTTSIHEQVLTQTNVAKGYLWNEETNKYDRLPAKNLNNVAPAGGIYSNVNDMAKWVRFLLNQGQMGEHNLVSKQQLQATRQPQIKINGRVSYGMGWFIQSWQGQPVIEHGGSIDGYSAQVALLPESNLGFVLLTNVTATPLQQASMNIVWEHLIKQDKPSKELTANKVNYAEYLGEYHANFGPFNDALFTLLIKKDGKPAIDVPGQTVYELKDPDQQGKWLFAMTDTIAISFDRSEDGAITAMRMHQNGLDFELPRKGVEILPEVDVAIFDPFLGNYKSNVFNGEIKAFIQNHRLTIDLPNEMAFELHLPDENGHRQFRIKADMSAVFEQQDDGEVTALALYRNKEKLIETAIKSNTEKSETLPTIEEINQLRHTKKRLKALRKNSGFLLEGEVNVVNSGIKGKVTTQFDDNKSYKQHLDFGVFGEVIVVINETQGVTYGINPYTEFLGPYLNQIRKEHPSTMINWQDHYDTVKVMGTKIINDKKTYAIKLKDSGIPSVMVYIDTQSGDILQYKTKILNPFVGSYEVQITYQDYRNLHGLRIPFKSVIKNQMMGEIIIQYQTLKADQPFNQITFNTEKPEDQN